MYSKQRRGDVYKLMPSTSESQQTQSTQESEHAGQDSDLQSNSSRRNQNSKVQVSNEQSPKGMGILSKLAIGAGLAAAGVFTYMKFRSH